MGSWADDAAGGTSVDSNLGPNDALSATTASAAFTFTTAGTYKVCYKVLGGSWTRVGTGQIAVTGVKPTGFGDDGSVTTGTSELISFTGGNGLNLANSADAVKIVAASAACLLKLVRRLLKPRAKGKEIPYTEGF